MEIAIPQKCLILLIGPSGSGKSTFAKKHFRSTEILSSDYFRSLISDDENDQSVTAESFEAVHFIAENRLKKGKLTVIDATNLTSLARDPLLRLAKRYHFPVTAIVFNLPKEACLARNALRPGRQVEPSVIDKQFFQLQELLKCINRKDFNHQFVLNDESEIDALQIRLVPLKCDKQVETGPFNIIGDIHGCFDELIELLLHLYNQDMMEYKNGQCLKPRKHIFIGDLIGPGSKNLETLDFVFDMVKNDRAFCVCGHSERELLQTIRNKKTASRPDNPISQSINELAEAIKRMDSTAVDSILNFIDQLESHYVFDNGNLIVAHAGILAEMQGRTSPEIDHFCLYGEPDNNGSYRFEWVEKYNGLGRVVYGHTPIEKAQWFNRTINIDTGCVFGNYLTAVQYPERKIISVKAEKKYI